ncbi:hypothetical protein PybrP1_004377 [[Pythium] brassicae (nom. inval.)]|nr:hypothetical protein PybrP1_004377 [[Pythium] brassicae (nom. inval.)]
MLTRLENLQLLASVSASCSRLRWYSSWRVFGLRSCRADSVAISPTFYAGATQQITRFQMHLRCSALQQGVCTKTTPQFTIFQRRAAMIVCQSSRNTAAGAITSSSVGTVAGFNSEHARCTYTNAKCSNTRALESNGELHRLCDDHRLRANEAQKRMTRKRSQR